MTPKYPLIAAGVAAALAGGYAQAAPPTITQAQSPFASLVIAGSSAAKNSVLGAVENDICGGTANTLLVSSAGGTKNFFALSCNTAVAIGSGAGAIPVGSLVTIYYRTEGGSVVGALPIASGHNILRLNLADSSCAGAGLTATCTVSGVTATAGPNDSWTGAVTSDGVDLGITDVEPALLTGADYPTGYSTTAFGHATPTQMAGLSTTRLIQQVFGLAINVGSAGSGLTAPINLSRESAANILLGNYSDWHAVPDALTGQPIAAASSLITRIDREPGSGTRTLANTYFLRYQCGSSTAITDNVGESDNFSTTDELTAANGKAASIAYTSIDQLQDPHNSTNFPNLVLATIDGVAPSNIHAAAGGYDYWFEATTVNNAATTGTSLSLASFLQTDMPKLASAPQEPSVNVIPGLQGNVGTVPLTDNGKTGTLTIYVNPYTRNGKSCNVPTETN